MMQSELINQEGEMLIVNLSKCLDSEALCELRVDQVSSDKVMQKIGLDKMMQNRYKEGRHLSP